MEKLVDEYYAGRLLWAAATPGVIIIQRLSVGRTAARNILGLSV